MADEITRDQDSGTQAAGISQDFAQAPAVGFDPTAHADQAPRAELVNPSGDSGAGDVTTQDIKDRLYDITNRAASDHEKGRQLNMELMQQINELSKTPMPEMPQLQDYPKPPNSEEQKKKNTAALGIFTALTLGLGFASGSRGSWGVWKGFEEGMRNMTEGQNARSQKAWSIWKEQVSAIHEQNQEKLNVYKDIMADRRATIKEKMDALKMIAGAYKDAAAQGVLEAKDWEGFLKIVSGMEKMQKDTETKMGKNSADWNKFIGTHPEHMAWIEEGLTKYPQIAGDYYSGNDTRRGKALMFLYKNFPWGKWHQEHWKEFHSTETAQEKDEVTPQATDEEHKALSSIMEEYFGKGESEAKDTSE